MIEEFDLLPGGSEVLKRPGPFVPIEDDLGRGVHARLVRESLPVDLGVRSSLDYPSSTPIGR